MKLTIHGHRWREALLLATGLALAVITGCQTGDIAEGVTAPSANATAKATGPQPKSETIGAGDPLIGYLSYLPDNQATSQAERDRRAGAAMAIRDLAGGEFSMQVAQVGDKPGEVEATTRRLGSSGIKLLITSAPSSSLPDIQRALAGRDARIILLADNGDVPQKSGAYPFSSNAVDGIVEAVSFAMAEGAAKGAILAPPGYPKGEMDRAKREIAAFGGSISATISVDAAGLNSRQTESLKAYDLVVLFPGIKNAPQIVRSIQDGRSASSRAMLVIAETTPTDARRTPELAGALVCRFGYNIQNRIGDRYLRETGFPVSLDAAYAYDATAMALGIARRYGREGLDDAHLTNPSGFRGAAGVFRLHSDGTVRRNCDMFRVSNGQFVFFQPAPTTF
ncbi:hypothetical protein [Rhizobium sp. NRK18]|uniref:hypothetical protein n=1 Tax=Rhizobium sp. NRK18 TaxID=2964667 RepID=UPI0021C4BB1A|nr:hypothetical protein [Rhizobium sp. NRK18]MCQ2003211.1 hypothetical protein [Rhizobium sp. NRK18]